MIKLQGLLAALALIAIVVGLQPDARAQPDIMVPENKAAIGKSKKAKDTKSEAKAKPKQSKAKAQESTSDKSKESKSKEAKKETKSKDLKSKDAKSKKDVVEEAKPARAAKQKSASAKLKEKARTAAATDAIPLPVPRQASQVPAGIGLASVGGAGVAIPNVPAATVSSSDLEATRSAIEHARAGRTSKATELQGSIKDAAARKLVEWTILRSDANGASSSRYMAFIEANPSWPSIATMRRRAESMMWGEQPDAQAVRAYFAKYPPLSARGHFAYARALLASGDRARAQAQAREAWHNDSFGADLEAQVLAVFGSLITDADHRARMHMRLYAEDVEAGLRNSNRLGANDKLIAKARVAVINKASNAKAALDAVPASARNDLGYIFSLAQWLRRAEKFVEAGDLILSAPREPSQVVDADQWWIERRLASRKMLDLGEPQKAYRIARDAVPPKRENYRGEHQFTAGWFALRFLNDPKTALTHFARVAEGTIHPTTLARSHYWQGRALDAMGRGADARAHYQQAAQYPTAYYGQLAAARLGLRTLALRPPPRPLGQPELARAIELLYAVGQREMVAGALADLGDRASDAATLAAVAEVAARNGDARAMLLLGKAALARGLPLEHYAFPTIGMPNYNTIGPSAEKSLVYAIARQESAFNPKAVSRARAMGLMQVMPATGRAIAKKHGVAFNERKLLSDPVFNVQLGAAELGGLLADVRGSYILAFVGYNAGRGRIREWIARYGDPRDPKVDAVDWVERIPFSETRNYVQRVMENMQVYRARFGGGDQLRIEADLRRGAVQ